MKEMFRGLPGSMLRTATQHCGKRNRGRKEDTTLVTRMKLVVEALAQPKTVQSFVHCTLVQEFVDSFDIRLITKIGQKSQ